MSISDDEGPYTLHVSENNDGKKMRICLLFLKNEYIVKFDTRPLNSHALSVRLTHLVSLSRSHAAVTKSHALGSFS